MPHILIVDDEEEIRNLASDILRLEGYQVDTAADGDEALEMAKEHEYDLALVDLVLPGGLNGLDIIRQLRGISKNIRIIAFTGFSGVNIAEKTARAGANGFMTKPFFTEQLIKAVGQWIGGNNGQKKKNGKTKAQQPAKPPPMNKKRVRFVPKIFTGFSDAAIEKIMKFSSSEKLLPGTKLKIDCNKELSIVYSGHLRCLYKNQVVNVLGPGDAIGEASIFLRKGQDFDLTLEAENACEIYIISKERLKNFFAEQNPSLFLRFSANIILNLSQKLLNCYSAIAKIHDNGNGKH